VLFHGGSPPEPPPSQTRRRTKEEGEASMFTLDLLIALWPLIAMGVLWLYDNR
jgi:hypothetical protein